MDTEKENIVSPPKAPNTDDDLETLKMLNGGSLPISSKPAANGGPPDETLQQKFARFKRERQRERKLNKFVSNTALKDRDENFRNRLREKFIQISKKYIGIPYSAKYHQDPSSEHYNAPLYLDCCGLIRRVLQDLKEDFGFRIGRWNQAYQFDSLPEILEYDQMKPGDLIFVEGTYNNPKARKQKYDILHIEIFLGNEKSIGARIQKGVIKIFDSYKFESKNYSIKKFHFRSLEPWLRGELNLQHPEHWLSRDSNISGGLLNDVTGIKSIFDDDDAQQAGDNDDIDNDDNDMNADVNNNGKVSNLNNKNKNKNIYDKNKKIFYCEKGNGWKLIKSSLENLGWVQLPFEYGFRTNFNLRWVQARSNINYSQHIPGQLVNHIPNNIILTSKFGLIETLRNYYHGKNQTIPDWFPESFRLDNEAECLKLISRHEELLNQNNQNDQSEKENETNAEGPSDLIKKVNEKVKPIWILKPSSKNCGKGIHLVNDINILRQECFGSLPSTSSTTSTSSPSSQTNGDINSNADSSLSPPPSLENGKHDPMDNDFGDEKEGISSIVSNSSEKEAPVTPIRGSAVSAARKLGELSVGSAEDDSKKEDRGAAERIDETKDMIAAAVATATTTEVEVGKEEENLMSQQRGQLVDVAQRYVPNPLLLNGKKFDLRVYALITKASEKAVVDKDDDILETDNNNNNKKKSLSGEGGGDLIVYFHPGYARLSLTNYGLDDIDNKYAHLTNAAIQKKHPEYLKQREESIWSFEQLDNYLYENKIIPNKGWASTSTSTSTSTTLDQSENNNTTTTTLPSQVKNIICETMKAASLHFHRGNGFFDLLGYDLLVDTQLKCHLLEINTNPALHMDNNVLKTFMPKLVDGALKLILKDNGKLKFNQTNSFFNPSDDASPVLPDSQNSISSNINNDKNDDDDGGSGGGGSSNDKDDEFMNKKVSDDDELSFCSIENTESFQLIYDEVSNFIWTP